MFSKLFISLLALIAGCDANAAFIPPASSVVQGGGGTSTSMAPLVAVPIANIDTAGFVNICGGTNSSTAGNYIGLYSQNSPTNGTQYQVPSGKTFYGIQLTIGSSSAGQCFQLGYGTATLNAADTSTAPTGNTLYAGSTASVCNGFFQSGSANTMVPYSILGLTFPALSYPYFRSPGSTLADSACLMGIVK